MVYFGDIFGHLFSAFLSYYFASIALRFAEQKVTEDIVGLIKNRIEAEDLKDLGEVVLFDEDGIADLDDAEAATENVM